MYSTFRLRVHVVLYTSTDIIRWINNSSQLVFPHSLNSYAGVLSALGLALADVVVEEQEPFAKAFSLSICSFSKLSL